MDDLKPWLASLVRDPNDAIALAQVQAAFDTLLAASSAGEIDQLPRAIQNLLRRLTDGTIAPNMAAAKLLAAEACSTSTDVDSDDALQLIERLDAFASGLGDVPVDSEPVPRRRSEPPLLTMREDGSRVLPGTFDATPSVASAASLVDESLPLEVALAAPSTTEHTAVEHTVVEHTVAEHTVAEIVAALELAADRLGAQVGTLELLAGPELRRLADDLSISATEIAQLKDALAECAERDVAG